MTGPMLRTPMSVVGQQETLGLAKLMPVLGVRTDIAEVTRNAESLPRPEVVIGSPSDVIASANRRVSNVGDDLPSL